MSLRRRVKILIVDDQKLFATSLEGILRNIGRDAIGGISLAFNGEEALRRTEQFRPDFILLDIHLPGMSGLDVLKEIRQRHPGIKVLIVSAFGYDTYVKEAVANGAVGYILKDTTPEEVMNAILSALGGTAVFSQEVLDGLAGRSRMLTRRGSVIPDWFPLLSDKEKKILLLISKGLSNEEIAEKVFLGKHTVRNYVSAIYEKMNAKDRFEAIRMAIEAQINTLVME